MPYGDPDLLPIGFYVQEYALLTSCRAFQSSCLHQELSVERTGKSLSVAEENFSKRMYRNGE